MRLIIDVSTLECEHACCFLSLSRTHTLGVQPTYKRIYYVGWLGAGYCNLLIMHTCGPGRSETRNMQTFYNVQNKQVKIRHVLIIIKH